MCVNHVARYSVVILSHIILGRQAGRHLQELGYYITQYGIMTSPIQSAISRLVIVVMLPVQPLPQGSSPGPILCQLQHWIMLPLVGDTHAKCWYCEPSIEAINLIIGADTPEFSCFLFQFLLQPLNKSFKYLKICFYYLKYTYYNKLWNKLYIYAKLISQTEEWEKGFILWEP